MNIEKSTVLQYTKIDCKVRLIWYKNDIFESLNPQKE